MRDGARLKADVFRPRSGARFPVIINLGSYQKDKLWVPPADLEEAPNPHMNWETVNPLWWVPRGYVALRVDSRGSGKSPGRTDPWSPSEARDFYDAIEWAGRKPRGLRACRFEAQDAAHTRGNAIPPVLLRRAPPRSAAVFRSLAQRTRYRHYGRGAGKAAHPQRPARQLRVASRERMADQAH